MSCNHPFKAFDTGNLTQNGKVDYIIYPSTAGDIVSVELAGKRKKISSSAPMQRINGKTYLVNPITIPCGFCVGCRMDKAREWKTRVVLESMEFKHSYFVTLTYDDMHLPKDNLLSKYDLDCFLKRLRKHTQFRYFACGEYGDQFGRPHYHLIIMTDYDLELVNTGVNKFRSSIIEKNWTFGLSEVSLADSGLISYVCGYIEKKQRYFEDKPVKKVMPFLCMSRKPALGTSYIMKHYDDIFKSAKVYGNFGQSHVANIPRSLFRKLEDHVDFMFTKMHLKNLAEIGQGLKDAMYNITDQEIQGFYQDDIQKMHLNQFVRRKL